MITSVPNLSWSPPRPSLSMIWTPRPATHEERYAVTGYTDAMSNVQYVFLPRSRVPSRRALQAAIDVLRLPLRLNPRLNLLKQRGFSPCELDGEDGAGIELGFERTSNVVAEESGFERFRTIAKTHDVCLTLCWHSGMDDCAAAMIVCCALAKKFGGVGSFEGGPAQGFREFRRAALQALSLWRKQRKRGRQRFSAATDRHFRKYLLQRPGWKLHNSTGRLSPNGSFGIFIANYCKGASNYLKASSHSCRIALYENTDRVRGAPAVYDILPKVVDDAEFVLASVDDQGNVTTFEDDTSGVIWRWFPLLGQALEGRLFDRRGAVSHPVVEDGKTRVELSFHVVRQVPRRTGDGEWAPEISLESVAPWAEMFSFSDYITTLPPFGSKEERDAYLEHLRSVRASILRSRRKSHMRELREYIETYVHEAESALTRDWRKATTAHRPMPRIRALQRRLKRGWDARAARQAKATTVTGPG